MLKKRTVSRRRLVKFLGIKTEELEGEGEESNNYPCTALSGPRAGEGCAFPFVFPDCTQTAKSSVCGTKELEPRSYNSCVLLDTDLQPWCYTRVYQNRSLIRGQYGYCSQSCTEQSSRYFSQECLMLSSVTAPSLDIARYNLGSSLYGENWEERLYGLHGAGHCHTFNPANVSSSGLRGQHSLYLGL